MKDVRFSAIRNAFANLVRGGATAIVALVLPRFLTRSLDGEHFAAWSLILQIAAYANYFDFGLQIAIGRSMAQAIELDQRERQARVIGTSLFLLMLAGSVAFLMVMLVLWQLPLLFSGIGPQLLPEFRRACLVLSLSACMLLPLSTYTGVLIGMHRNEIPAIAIGGSRIVGAVVAILVATHVTQSLSVLAVCIAVPNLLGGLAQMTAVRNLLEQSRSSLKQASRTVARELLRFCASLSIWSFAGFLMSGLDLTIVGHFRFSAVGPYALASMVTVFLIGLTNSLLSALLAPMSALHARGDQTGMLRMLMSATRVTLLINLAFCAAVFFLGAPLLLLWVGPVYAAGVLPILEVLAIAYTIRFVVGPLSTLLIAAGEPNKAISFVVFESIVNLAASILGVVWFGAIGAAWGTLVGALCGLAWIGTRVVPALSSIPLKWRSFVAEAVVPACVPMLPLLVLWAIRHSLGATAHTLSAVLCLTMAAMLTWRLYKVETATPASEL